MNDRIQQLMKQASTTRVTGFGEIDTLDPEKFAVLIIRECARVAIEKQTENDLSNIVSKNPAKDFAYALIAHFGVTE